MERATPVALLVLQLMTGSTVLALPWTQVLGALTENEVMAGGLVVVFGPVTAMCNTTLWWSWGLPPSVHRSYSWVMTVPGAASQPMKGLSMDRATPEALLVLQLTTGVTPLLFPCTQVWG